MKNSKKALTIVIAAFIISSIFAKFSGKVLGVNISAVEGEPVKVGVLVYTLDDDYMSLVRQSLDEIQKQNPGKVQFFFYDSKRNQRIQDDNLNTVLKNKVDLILLSLWDTKTTQEAINRIKEYNIPVILFNREPVMVDAIKCYEKAYYVGTDAKESGIIQGEILINAWENNKATIDKNRDGIMQYIMLKGPKNDPGAIERTKYSVLTINNAGIKTEELASIFGDFKKEIAKERAALILLKYAHRVEVVISNNDSMAEGAIEALQLLGYNKGDKTKTIPVVGVDAIPSAQELIKQGVMEGTVVQDPKALAKAMYDIGMNLVYGKKPLEGTNYQFDETGIAVRIPYYEYKVN